MYSTCSFYKHRPPRPDQFTPGTDYGMFYDLGVYGTPGPVQRRQKYDAVKAMRAMEKYVLSDTLKSFH